LSLRSRAAALMLRVARPAAEAVAELRHVVEAAAAVRQRQAAGSRAISAVQARSAERLSGDREVA